jgi:hypothetical protein
MSGRDVAYLRCLRFLIWPIPVPNFSLPSLLACSLYVVELHGEYLPLSVSACQGVTFYDTGS